MRPNHVAVLVDVVDEPNKHEPHPLCAALRLVPRASHVWRLLSPQKDAVPDSCELPVRVRA